MRYLIFLSVLLVCLQPPAKAQSILLPAGTLIHCSIDDPNFSTKTAEVGDPVLCHLESLTEFGRSVFPRGSYLEGRLEESKEPGRFIGKGFMKIVFDRLGLPDMDAQLDSKMVAARGQNVNKQGDIVGHGHAKRDVAEWVIPPLWPWKVLTLPNRGPAPSLKSEQTITLRLMEDLEVPQGRSYPSSSSQWHPFGLESPYPRTQMESCDRQQYSSCAPQLQTPRDSTVNYTQPSYSSAAPALRHAQTAAFVRNLIQEQPVGVSTLLVLKPNMIYEVTDYWVDGRDLCYVMSNGTEGWTSMDNVDWDSTAELNSNRGVHLSLRTGPSGY